MTIVGVIWLFIVMCCFVIKDIKYMLYITLLFMTFQSCNVLVFEGTGIGPGVLTSIIFIIKVLVNNYFKIRRIQTYRKVNMLCIAMFCVVVASCIKNGVLYETRFLILQLFVYVLCFISIQYSLSEISSETIYSVVRSLIIFHCIFAIIQLLTTMNILPLRPLLNLFVYNDLSTNVVFHKTYYNRMMSTLMEPSYYAPFLVGAFYFLVYQREKWHENRFLLIIVFIEILLTRSSTAYGTFLIVGIVFIAFSKSLSLKKKIIIIFSVVVLYAIFYMGFYTLLDDVIFSKNESASYRQRVRFDTSALEAFRTSPFFGIGYKQCRGSSIITSLLGQSGIIGLVIYFCFNAFAILKKDKNTLITLKIPSSYAVLAAIITQLLACPDLDLCTYWLWLYVYSASIKQIRKRKKDE